MSWGALVTGITSTISAVAGAISSAASAIGGVVGSGLGVLSKVIVKMPDIFTVIEMIDAVCSVVDIIARLLGVKKEEESTEELGERALQADKKPEDFDSVEEYIEYLRNEVEIDKEKLENMNETDKAVRKSVGASILAKGISEKKEINVGIDFFIEAARQKMTVKEVELYIDTFKENNAQLKLTDFFKGNLSAKENLKIYTALEEVLKNIDPNMSEDDIENKIEDMRKNSEK